MLYRIVSIVCILHDPTQYWAVTMLFSRQRRYLRQNFGHLYRVIYLWRRGGGDNALPAIKNPGEKWPRTLFRSFCCPRGTYTCRALTMLRHFVPHNGERECRAKWPEQEMAATALIDCWVFWVYTLCPMQRLSIFRDIPRNVAGKMRYYA